MPNVEFFYFETRKVCRNIRNYTREYFYKGYFSRSKILFHLIQILRTYIDAINFIFSLRTDIDRLISTKCTVQTFLTFNVRQYGNMTNSITTYVFLTRINRQHAQCCSKALRYLPFSFWILLYKLSIFYKFLFHEYYV